MSAKKSVEKSKLVKEDIDESPAKRFKNATFDVDDMSSQYQASARTLYTRASAKKKTETSSGSNPEFRKKILDLVNSQQEARKQRTEDFFKGFSKIITQVEVFKYISIYNKAMTAAYKEKLTALREIQDSFKKGYEEMESEHQTENEKFVDELELDINKLVAETKRSGWEAQHQGFLQAMQKDM